MRADPFVQLRLLDVQQLDIEIDQNRHRASELPAIATANELAARQAALRDHTVAAATRASDLSRELRKAESDVEQVRARAERDSTLLASGSVTSPKQLADLEHEVASLAKRQSDLEDAELEVMEAVEVAEAEHAQLVEQSERVAGELAEAVAARDAALAELDADLTDLQARRAEAVAGIPAELLALYVKIRDDRGGIAAALVKQARCEACRLQLPPGDLDEIAAAAPDEVVRCPECRSILIRTDESGL